MRPSAIAWAYITSWFATDVLIVSIDMVFAVIDAQVKHDAMGVAHFATGARLLRFLRLLRVLRLRRMMEMASRVTDAITSQFVLMAVRVVGLVGGILTLNHFIACAWYAIGVQGEVERSWTRGLGLPEDDAAAVYICAYHWALTQFTPATQNIAPATAEERLFACAVVLVALVTFSTFLGKMTSTMTQLLNINAARLQQEVKLRGFLYDRKIPTALSRRIWHVYRHKQRITAHQHRLTLRDIDKSLALPSDVRNLLCEELYHKAILTLPIMEKILEPDCPELRDICLAAVEEKSADPAQEVFATGMVAENALCITFGRFHYSSHRLTETVEVNENTWVSEAALWGFWKRCGSLSAVTVGRWLEINGGSFRNIVLDESVRAWRRRMLCRYASRFADEIELEDMLDIDVDQSDFDTRERLWQLGVRTVSTNGPQRGVSMHSAASARATRAGGDLDTLKRIDKELGDEDVAEVQEVHSMRSAPVFSSSGRLTFLKAIWPKAAAPSSRATR
mmetsp:Transcript_65477/g.188706  ORF Transcript_65477/g.188706 Transcript_65477/m.188706 type:complete len:507 (+) Transcript_65477:2-1522(+)